MAIAPEPNIVIVPGSSLPLQPWWKALYLTINTSFQNKDGPQAYPPTWTRLPPGPREGAERLKEELGPDGLIAVVLLVDRPIACAGVLPFRGLNWISTEKSADEGNPEHAFSSNPKILERAAMQEELSDEPMQKRHPPIELDKGDFEICCMCIHPLHRRIGLSQKLLRALEDSVRPLGGKRLFANYVVEENGRYWPKMGFETIPGAGGILKKGFTHTDGTEPLREDLHFAMGVRSF